MKLVKVISSEFFSPWKNVNYIFIKKNQNLSISFFQAVNNEQKKNKAMMDINTDTQVIYLCMYIWEVLLAICWIYVEYNFELFYVGLSAYGLI